MRTSKFTVEQIAHSLRQVESGVTVAEPCRDLGITETTLPLGDRRPTQLRALVWALPADRRWSRSLPDDRVAH